MALSVSSMQINCRPLIVRGQPPPVQLPVAGVPSQSQVTAGSMHQCSPVKLELVHRPPAAQSASVMHGSQVVPAPLQLPERCEQVASISSSSETTQIPALPQGHDPMATSQSCVHILRPLV